MSETNLDRFNWSLLALDDLQWGRDEIVPAGRVSFTAITDGRMIGAHRLLLNAARNDINSLSLEASPDPRMDGSGRWVGRWLVEDGCYEGAAGARNRVLFWVEAGIIVGITGTSRDDWARTFAHMLHRLEKGDTTVVPTDEEQLLMDQQRERAKLLPRLRIPGDPPPEDWVP